MASEASAPLGPGILLVDDDRAVRRMLALLLPKHGFVVWQAASGREALELYSRHREQIDLVLLDVRMPGQDGPQILRALRAADPKVRCCFMSGYGGIYSDEELLGMGAVGFFQKPFRLVELVRELLLLTTSREEPAPHNLHKAPAVDLASPPGEERRASVRYLCQLKNSCQPLGRIASGETWQGTLRDISAGGLRLMLGRRFEPGTLLILEVPGTGGEGLRRLLARVVRVVRSADQQWGHGCSFISDLSAEDLNELLA